MASSINLSDTVVVLAMSFRTEIEAELARWRSLVDELEARLETARSTLDGWERAHASLDLAPEKLWLGQEPPVQQSLSNKSKQRKTPQWRIMYRALVDEFDGCADAKEFGELMISRGVVKPGKHGSNYLTNLYTNAHRHPEHFHWEGGVIEALEPGNAKTALNEGRYSKQPITEDHWKEFEFILRALDASPSGSVESRKIIAMLELESQYALRPRIGVFRRIASELDINFDDAIDIRKTTWANSWCKGNKFDDLKARLTDSLANFDSHSGASSNGTAETAGQNTSLAMRKPDSEGEDD